MSSSSLVDQQNPSWQRTVLLATDNCQSIIAEIADGKTNTLVYSAYGEQSAQQEVATRLGFNGQLREARIGWYILGNGYRAYNPRLMRFHSPDSWSPFGRGGLNPYTYCLGNPVNCTDPTGHGRSFFSHFKSPQYRSAPPPYISPEAGAAAMRSMLKDQPLPQKTSDVLGMLGAVGFIAGPKPKISWTNTGGELHGSAHSSSTWKNQDKAPLVSWTVSGRSSDSGPPIPSGTPGSHPNSTPRQSVSSTGLSASGPPPSYAEATAGTKKEWWTYDTFAHAQPKREVTVLTQANPRQNFVQPPPPLQHPVPIPPPPEAVNPRTGMTAEQARIRHGQNRATLHRARNP